MLSCVLLFFSVKVLADIELAQTLKSETEKAQEEMIETVPHPLDQDYNSLKCILSHLDTKTESFKVQSNAKLTHGHDMTVMSCLSSVLLCRSAWRLRARPCSESQRNKDILLTFLKKSFLFFLSSRDMIIILKATATTKKSMWLSFKDHRKVPENDFGWLPQSKDSQRLGGGQRDGGKSSSTGLTAQTSPG